MKKRKEARFLFAALLLLALAAAWVLWNGRAARQRRDATLAQVPPFPAPRQEVHPRPPGAARPAAHAAAKAPQQSSPARQDGMLSLVQAAKGSVALIHVNALFNTPLFDRLRECMPEAFNSLASGKQRLDIDPTRDIDRVALSQNGVAVSGFFAGKPLAEKLLGEGAAAETYRGASVFTRGQDCVAQLGNLLVMGKGDGCRETLDAAMEKTPDSAQDEIYGDLYVRSDLASFRNEQNPLLRSIVDGLSGMTVRANVWDAVALSLEGAPASGKDAAELAQMVRAAVRLAKTQLDDDQIELQTLADLAKVSTEGGKLHVDAAIPVADLLERFHIPCPGRDAGPPEAGSEQTR